MVLGALFLGTMPTPGHGERPQGQDRASLEHPLPGASPLAQAAQTAAGWEAANLPFNIYIYVFPPTCLDTGPLCQSAEDASQQCQQPLLPLRPSSCRAASALWAGAALLPFPGAWFGEKGRKIPPFALEQGETQGWTHKHPSGGPSFCPRDVFWDMKALGLHPRPRCRRLRGPAAPTAPAMLARGAGRGRGTTAKIGKWRPEKVSMCVDSSKAREGFREKNNNNKKITSYG